MKNIKSLVKKLLPSKVVTIIEGLIENDYLKRLQLKDSKKFKKYSFGKIGNTNSQKQLEARIIKDYHSIEKGLSYKSTRYFFGKEVINNLYNHIEKYKNSGYPMNSFVINTAISNINNYIKIHEDKGLNVDDIKHKFNSFNVKGNNCGGVIERKQQNDKKSKDFYYMASGRHSSRDFINKPTDIKLINKALILAQNAPSACNRQGWRTRVITNKKKIDILLKNQNGNKGFGHRIPTFILITSDLSCFSRSRERNQPYIDGGLYSMNLLYSLNYYGFATISLSASLSDKQEKAIRGALCLDPSEVFVMIIGVGHPTNNYKTPRSERKIPDNIIIE